MIDEASRDSSAQPWLRHAWLGDDFLRSLVEDYFSRTTNCLESGAWAEAEGDLERFGWRCITEVHDLGREAGRREAEPRLIDVASGSGHEREASWRKVDGSEVESSRRVLWTSEAWKKLHALSAEGGLVACAYDKRKSLGAFSRTFQFAKLYMFNASSGLYSCPLAMTDGAARLCEILKEESPDRCPIHERAYPHLVSRDPKSFWTSGQWMTELDGGSDVGSGCQTMATPIDPSGAESEGWADTKLTGYKWFSSATDANMAFALARESAAGGAEAPIGGSRGLSLFYVEVREDHGGRGGGGTQARTTIRLKRLKDKLGTRQLPTAELELVGVPAARASRKGRGVARISEMMNITRVHNAITASSYMRRISNITADYACRRKFLASLCVSSPWR